MKNITILKKIIIYFVIGIVSLIISYLFFGKVDFFRHFGVIYGSSIFGSLVGDYISRKKKSSSE